MKNLTVLQEDPSTPTAFGAQDDSIFVRHSSFVIGSSFVIRHSSFV
jgi:hypothetical protein